MVNGRILLTIFGKRLSDFKGFFLLLSNEAATLNLPRDVILYLSTSSRIYSFDATKLCSKPATILVIIFWNFKVF